jgi:hypothetical protein
MEFQLFRHARQRRAPFANLHNKVLVIDWSIEAVSRHFTLACRRLPHLIGLEGSSNQTHWWVFRAMSTTVHEPIVVPIRSATAIATISVLASSSAARTRVIAAALKSAASTVAFRGYQLRRCSRRRAVAGGWCCRPYHHRPGDRGHDRSGRGAPPCHLESNPDRPTGCLPGNLRAYALSPSSAGSRTCPRRGRLRPSRGGGFGRTRARSDLAASGATLAL